ncbi:PREDICTED: myosin-M heavy chain-like [Amphimedon queenslandica]|uniref:Uncharacterized protein n=1 Tax=Amphimedon queenslandica TaxID=400682 RepID=A0A1X7TZ91_AMPQE|nr:PREDICTED: myosin-M heavy chain-like [Amphimedon queenslandica]|eukprot:XP_003389437.1 PREDICTED: myosin-M heavy chain-like [Amphimedon queenslandica]
MEDISEEENEATSQEDVLDYHQKELKEQREHHLYQLKSLQGQLLDNLIAYVSDSNESVSPDIRQRILSSIKRESTTSCDTQTTQQTISSSYPDSLLLSHSNVSRNDSGTSDTLRDTSSGTLVEKWATPVESTTSGRTLNSQAVITSLHSSPSLPPTLNKECINESESPLPENSSHNSSILTPPYLTPPKQAYNPSASPENTQQACRSPLSPISNNNASRSLIPKTLVPNPSSMEVLVSENESLRIRNGQLNEELEQFNSINSLLKEQMSKMKRSLTHFEEERKSQNKLMSSLHYQLSGAINQLREQEDIKEELTKQLHTLRMELDDVKQKDAEKKELYKNKEVENAELRDENSFLREDVKVLERQLKNLQDETLQLQSLMDRQRIQTEQYQSALAMMDDELQRLRLIERYPSPQQYLRSLDRNKTPPPPCHTPSPPHHAPSTTSHTSPPTHHAPAFNYTTSPKVQRRPLTRKRWLETSENGFIFGTPPQKELQVSPQNTTKSATQLSPVDAALDAIRTKRVTTASPPAVRKRQGLEERVEERLRITREAEQRLTVLQKEKAELESFLQRGPPNNRVTAEYMQRKNETERKLDHVLKEIGAVRMIIRNPTSWKI